MKNLIPFAPAVKRPSLDGPPFILMMILLVISATSMFAQGVQNVKATVKDDLIVVTYDLLGSADDKFDVALYYSKNNFSEPLNMVTGDVGKGIKPGLGKRIEWLAKTEMGEFSGNLIFEIKAVLPEPTYSQLAFKYFTLTEIKTGKSYRLQWEGGNPTQPIDIYLFENGEQKSRIVRTENTGSFVWKIPKPSKNATYKVQLKGEKSSAMSSEFEIKKPFPTALVAGGGLILAGGVVAAVILLNGDDSGKDLPLPPNPDE